MPEKVTINDVNLSPFGVWYVSTMKSITLKSPTNEDILENIVLDGLDFSMERVLKKHKTEPKKKTVYTVE